MTATMYVTIALRGGETIDFAATPDEVGAILSAWESSDAAAAPAFLSATCDAGRGRLRIALSEIAAVLATPDDEDGEDEEEDDEDEEEDEEDEEEDDEDGGDEEDDGGPVESNRGGVSAAGGG